MKILLSVLVVLILFSISSVPLIAGEEKIAEEEKLELSKVTADMARVIQENPVSLPKYLGTQINWWVEILARFAKTAKPTVVFKDKVYPGLEISIKEWDKVVLTWGKVFQIEDGKLIEQPSFLAIETKDIPLLSDTAEIFSELRLQAVYVDEKLWFGLAYELTEE